MQIFIANIDSISKNPDMYSGLLLPKHKLRLPKFQNQTRKLQFILGHLIADNFGKKHTCIAHKDKLVVVAVSDKPIGIDIENTSVNRDFIAASELMSFTKPKSLDDFYKSFTEAEAAYKLGRTPKCVKFTQYGDYLICVAAPHDFYMPDLQEYDLILMPKQK